MFMFSVNVAEPDLNFSKFINLVRKAGSLDC